MPDAFRGCLVSISSLSDAALEDRISTVSNLLEAIRSEEKTATGFRKHALSEVANFLSLLEDQARSEWANRGHQKELERRRQILAEVIPPSQENDTGYERQCDRDRLLTKIKDTEELIHLRQSVKESVEGELSALSAIQIDSYLAVAGLPTHDPIRLSLSCPSARDPKATENSSEPSLAQSFKEFAAKIFIDLNAQYPRGVPAGALVPFASECDAREYLLTSEFLRERVLKAVKEYNFDFPQAQIKKYSDLVAVLNPVSASSGPGPVKKRKKDSKQVVSRQFRVWLYENKRDYLEKLKKRRSKPRVELSSLANRQEFCTRLQSRTFAVIPYFTVSTHLLTGAPTRLNSLIIRNIKATIIAD
jgi:hypothetical protein